MSKDKIKIPYNEAGKRAFDVFYKVATKLYTAAQEATDEYIAKEYPESRIIDEKYAKGKYKKIIATPEGNRQICYNFETKEIRQSPSQPKRIAI